ncbi:MAG: hypothetical protein U9N72_11165 [Bacteroidota bacterium]|nr:hypothetical protein [Bacteroidota bacterium]
MRLYLKFISVFLLTFMNIFLLDGQQYFLEGEIVSAENELLEGFIDYRDWKYNPDIIRFIPDGKITPLTFSPSDLMSFTVNNERFIAAEVTIERTPDNLDELLNVGGRIISREKVFLRVLVEGLTSLYYYNERQSGKHFYIRKDIGGEIIELKQYSVISEIEGQKEVLVQDEYKDQLENIMRDCPMLIPMTHLVDYNRSELTELVEEYNKCLKGEIYYVAELPSVEYEARLSAGLSAFYINFRGSGSDDLVVANFPISHKPYAAVGLNIIFPFSRKTFSVYNEAGIHIYESSDHIQWYESEKVYEDVEMTLGATRICLLNTIRYTYPAKRFRPFIYAGVVNTYSFNITNNKKSVMHFYSTVTEHTSEAIAGHGRYSFSLAGGIGIKYKNAGLDLRYELGRGIKSTTNVSSSTYTVFFLLHYSF